MDKSKRNSYQKLYKAARRKVGKNGACNKDNDSDSNDDIPLKKQKQIFVNHTKVVSQNGEESTSQHLPPSLHYDDNSSIEDTLSINSILSSDSSDQEIEQSESNFQHKLRNWAIKFNITQNATDDLLKILRFNGHPRLPATARTFLHTTQTVKTKIVSNMDYYFFGLKFQLNTHIENALAADVIVPTELHISLNIDGLPLYKSSKKSLWPVLAFISNICPKVVFPVAITCGDKKPNNLDFLSETIDDLNSLIYDGLTVGNTHYSVFIKCIVCDAPARSMVKCTKLYSGYYGCDKCEQRGLYVDGKVTFPSCENLVLRSDERFRSRVNVEHHHDDSPLCRLPIDMVHNFPIDYMHQTCLGVMKRLLVTWIRGKRQNRLSTQQKDMISARLIKLQSHIPSIFARKPRTLDDIDYWKATEFRQFLFYTGRVVLKGILSQKHYSNFQILSVAICILTSKRLNIKYNATAEQFLTTFLKESSSIYGPEFMVYNVHGLSHISADAYEYECLDNCSVFAFENYLQHLKKRIRSSRYPLVQVIKRLQESDCVKTPYKCDVKTKSFSKSSDNAFVLSDNTVCKVVDSARCIDATIECEVFYHTISAFVEPIDSKEIGIHRVTSRKAQSKMIKLSELTRQAILLPIGNGDMDFIEVLHSE